MNYLSFLSNVNLFNFFTSTPEVKKDIMQVTPLFGPTEWQELGVELRSTPEIPEEINNYLDTACPFWNDKLVKETHFLCLIPDTLTLSKLYELMGFNSNSPYLAEAVDHAEMPYWILITKKTIPDTRGQSFDNQKNLISNYNYRIPSTLEAGIAVVCAKLNDVLIYPHAGEFTRCQTQNSQAPISIGSDRAVPFSITSNDWNAPNGVAGIYKW